MAGRQPAHGPGEVAPERRRRLPDVVQLVGRDRRWIAESIEALFARDIVALGTHARVRAVTRHGWDRVFTNLTEIYAGLTGEMAFTRANEPVGA